MIKVEDENGVEVDAFTLEEVEAEKKKVEEEYKVKLDEVERQKREKLDEFIQGKKGIDQKEEEFNTQLKAANEASASALAKVEEERQARLGALKNYIFEQYGGVDKEVREKLDKSWDLINVPVNNDEDVKQRAKLAADLAGLGDGHAAPASYSMPVGGGYAPTFNKVDTDAAADHETFLREVGMEHLIKPKS